MGRKVYNGLSDHWLSDRLDEGGFIVLEDDSVWQIAPAAQRKTSRWLRYANLVVKRHHTDEGIRYTLLNLQDNQEVAADYLGIASYDTKGRLQVA